MSLAASLDFTYRYRFATTVEQRDGSFGLRLATFGGEESNPCFFEGQIKQAKVVADTLLALSNVVRTHFFLPRPALLDPVITCSDGVLRFEGFSGCCGVYARVDLRSETFDCEITGRGTTNVDFNAEMCVGLAKLRSRRDARLAVGTREVALHVGDEAMIEKRVKLPIRWITCFSEVQAYQPTLKMRFEVKTPEILRFIRGLPHGGSRRSPAWVVPAGRGLRLSQREQRNGVRVMGLDRLRALENLATTASGLRVWSDDGAGVSAWEVLFETGRFLLVISPELYRGFSGEGQVLESLARKDWQDVIASVRAALTWNAHVDVARVAIDCDISEDDVTAALAALGARGLVGYDIADGKYFHRELPFDLSQVEALQPRLTSARKLVAEKRVREHQRISDDRIEILVIGTDVDYLVRLNPEQDRCTCLWFSKYRGERGPCKHVLAARMFVDGDDDDA